MLILYNARPNKHVFFVFCDNSPLPNFVLLGVKRHHEREVGVEQLGSDSIALTVRPLYLGKRYTLSDKFCRCYLNS